MKLSTCYGVLIHITFLHTGCLFWQADGIQYYSGTLLPVDPQVCVSENVTFTCTLLSDPQPNKSIVFFVQPPSPVESPRSPVELVPVNENDVTKVNESVSIYNIKALEENIYMIRCYYSDVINGTRPPTSELLGSVSSMFATKESKPVVRDFKCIVYNYVDSMNCSWEYEGHFHARPSVSFSWRIQHFSSWMRCPDLNTGSNFCYWRTTKYGDFSMKLIEIKIELKYQTCGNRIAYATYINESVDTSLIVKPNPVDRLTNRVINSTCIELIWATENSRPEYPKQHKITIVGKWGPETVKHKTSGVNEKQHNHTFCGLEEYTKYRFTVAIKPEDGGYWSEGVVVANKTWSSVPAASPAVVPGGYAWNPQDCKHENRRSVCIMMQSIAPINENGDMKGIKVFYRTENSSTSPPRLLSKDSTYRCEDLLLCNQSYEVVIVPYNDAGDASNGSRVYIEKWDNGIVQPSLRVETTNQTNADKNYSVHLRWTHPPVDNVKGYYVFQCIKEQGGCKGNGGIMKWKFYPANVHEASLSDISSPEELSYGVSLVTDQGSSGLQWVTCIYTAGVCPTQAVQNVLVTTGSEDNSLVVNWDKLPCRSGQPYISHYVVRYCQENTGHCKDIVLGANWSRLVLNDLDEVKYSVKVKGLNEYGCAGPYSQLVYDTPINRALKSDEIAGIVSGGLVLVVLAAVGLVCCLRRGKMRFKVWKSQASAIKLPDIDVISDGQMFSKPELDTITSTTFDRQYSNDSGVPETPKPDGNKHPGFTILPDGYCVGLNVDVSDHNSDWSANKQESSYNASNVLNELDHHKTLLNEELRNGTVAFQTESLIQSRVVSNLVTSLTKDNQRKGFESKSEKKDSGMTDGYKKATINTSDELGVNETSECDHDETKLEETLVRNPSLSCFIPKPTGFTSISNSTTDLYLDESNSFTADHSSAHDHSSIPDYVQSLATNDEQNSYLGQKTNYCVNSSSSGDADFGHADKVVSSYVKSHNPNAGYIHQPDYTDIELDQASVGHSSNAYVPILDHNANDFNSFESDVENASDFDEEPEFAFSADSTQGNRGGNICVQFDFDQKPHVIQTPNSSIESRDHDVDHMTNAAYKPSLYVRSHDQYVGHMTNADLTPSSHVRSHDQNVGHMTNADLTPSSYLRSPDRNIGRMTKADSYATSPERIDVGLDKNLDIKLPSFLDQSPDPYVATPDEAVEVFNQSSQVSGLAGACKRLDDKQASDDRPDAYVTTVTPSLQPESTHSNPAPSDSYITPPPMYDDNHLSQCLIRGELSSDSSSSLSLASYDSSDDVQSAPQNVPDLNVTPDPMVDSNGNDLVHNEISPSVTDSIAQENDSHDNASSCSLLFCQTSGNNNGIHKICSSVVTSPYVDADQMAKLNLAPMVPKVSKSENVQYPVSNEGSSKALDDSVLVNASIKQQSPHNQSSETGYVQLDTILQQNVEPVQSPELDNQSDTSSSSETEIAVGSGPVTNYNLLENELHIDMNKNLVGVHQSDDTEVSKMLRQRQETLYSPTPMDVNSDDSGHRSSRNDSGASDSSVDSVTSTRLHLERSNKVRHNSDSGLSNLSFETAGIY